MPVAQLHRGMHVLRADGNVGVVTGWKVVPGTKVMYNLEVAQDHTFTVGTGEWVVHNCEYQGSYPTNFSGANRDSINDPQGFASDAQWDDHWTQHGTDFGSADKQTYEQQANNFMSNAPNNDELQLTRTNGDTLRWDTKTGEFGVVTSDGYIKTYFDISGKIDPYAYFTRQYW
ncbi:MAG: hypothetical protein ACYDER_16820 [Ktedonobacteraceae bacterium]